MKNLFVGCRVRLVGKWDGPFSWPTGLEGRICGFGGRGFWSDRQYEWAVDVPGFGNVKADSDELEPIVPPHEASQYSYTELMDRLKAGEVECV